MEISKTATLLKLGDADVGLADPAEVLRGRTMEDIAGERIGTVEELLIDNHEKKVRLLQVAAGGSLGLDETKFIIPVDVITWITDDTVYIDRTRAEIVGAPHYDPDFLRALNWAPIYGYYGYPAYCTLGQ